MIPNLRLIVWGVAAAAVVAVGIYAKVIYNKAQRVPELERQVAEIQRQLEVERHQNVKALEAESELRQKLADADRRSDEFARRLRRALKSVPEAPAAPAEPERAEPGERGISSAGLDAAINRVRRECAKAGILERGWADYYDGIPAELK